MSLIDLYVWIENITDSEQVNKFIDIQELVSILPEKDWSISHIPNSQMYIIKIPSDMGINVDFYLIRDIDSGKTHAMVIYPERMNYIFATKLYPYATKSNAVQTAKKLLANKQDTKLLAEIQQDLKNIYSQYGIQLK